jgi:hypothetical protein
VVNSYWFAVIISYRLAIKLPNHHYPHSSKINTQVKLPHKHQIQHTEDMQTSRVWLVRRNMQILYIPKGQSWLVDYSTRDLY